MNETATQPSPALRWGQNGLILFALTLALYLGRSILIPAVLALLLTCLLWPMVVGLHRLRFPWWLACTATVSLVVILVACSALAITLLIPQLVESLPNTPSKANAYYSHLRSKLGEISPLSLDEHYLPENADDSALMAYLRSALDPKTPGFVLDLLKGLFGFGTYWLVQSVLVLFTLFFFLLEGNLLTRRIVELFGTNQQTQQRVLLALRDMAAQVRTFLVWRTLVNVAVAIIMGLLYYLFTRFVASVDLGLTYCRVALRSLSGYGSSWDPAPPRRFVDLFFSLGGHLAYPLLHGFDNGRRLLHRASGDGTKHGSQRHNGHAFLSVLGISLGAGRFVSCHAGNGCGKNRLLSCSRLASLGQSHGYLFRSA